MRERKGTAISISYPSSVTRPRDRRTVSQAGFHLPALKRMSCWMPRGLK
ncbi:MAG: hypothetical protein JRJ84_17570 [Deltaproteobacteria bacterium]|nr:hypothetical protein [Deltaproteobacteria bacterium]